MIRVVVFSGGEYVAEDSIDEMQEWSVECAVELLRQYYSDYQEGAICEDMFESGPKPIIDTVEEVITGRMFQGVEDATDGGQIYIVKID